MYFVLESFGEKKKIKREKKKKREEREEETSSRLPPPPATVLHFVVGSWGLSLRQGWGFRCWHLRCCYGDRGSGWRGWELHRVPCSLCPEPRSC